MDYVDGGYRNIFGVDCDHISDAEVVNDPDEYVGEHEKRGKN